MRLTVGPLPAAVYWRRRAVVLVSLAMVVLVISYSCTGPDTPASGSGAPSQSASASLAATTTKPAPTPTATPTPPPFTLPGTAATGPCTDAEIDLSATPASESVPRGQSIDLTIKIKNTSGRTCSRDLGADQQELRILLDGNQLVWSSDDCNARKGSDVRSLAPGKEITFTLTWAGTRSRTATGAVDCNAASPNAATYQLVARLDQKLSQPVALRVR